MSVKSKKSEKEGKTIQEIEAEVAQRFNYENLTNTLNAFADLKNAIGKCNNGKPEIIDILRNGVEKAITAARYKFMEAAKKEGVWDEYVSQHNAKMREILMEYEEFQPTGESGVFTNNWGDTYSINPVTGLLEQTA